MVFTTITRWELKKSPRNCFSIPRREKYGTDYEAYNTDYFLSIVLSTILSKAICTIETLHWEKRFDWIKENNLFERLSLI